MKNKKNKSLNKKGMELDMLGWILIAVVAMVILLFVIVILSGKGTRAIEFIQNLFKFKTTG